MNYKLFGKMNFNRARWAKVPLLMKNIHFLYTLVL